MSEYDDDGLETDELIIVLGLVGLGGLIIAAAFLFDALDIGSWGFVEWSSVAIIGIIVIGLFVAVVLGSDDEGEQGGVFTSYGFALTVGFLIVGLIAIQTNFFGLVADDSILIDIDGDGTGDIQSSQIPEGYVDYGEPQPYGFGNYGPENEGLLTDGQGCAAGAAAGAGTGLALGLSSAPWTAGIGLIGGPLIGGIVGCGLGFFGSSADFDGDPTTGW